jgi:endogenous inhibitor of DNA gyrase (YacG/DUF329 family)
MATTRKVFKCPICHRPYVNKQAVYTHMYKDHADEIPDNMSAAQYAFNLRNKKEYGLCVQCRTRKTKWNEEAERYDRFCSDECKNAYVAEAKRRMLNKYGKEHLLNDEEQQQKMLNNRSISGHYTFEADKISVPYNSKLEYAFLRHMNYTYGIGGKDIIQCPYVFEYEADGKKHLYRPDFFALQWNLVIEIKSSGNKNPGYLANDHTEEKEKAMLEQNEYNYIKIYDEKYTELSNIINMIKNMYWDNPNPDLQAKVSGIKVIPKN